MTCIYLLSSQEDRPIAFTSYEHAAEWFMNNIVNEYCEWFSTADEELAELCGPNYLDPSYGNLEIMLDRFEYTLVKILLDPN